MVIKCDHVPLGNDHNGEDADSEAEGGQADHLPPGQTCTPPPPPLSQDRFTGYGYGICKTCRESLNEPCTFITQFTHVEELISLLCYFQSFLK